MPRETGGEERRRRRRRRRRRERRRGREGDSEQHTHAHTHTLSVYLLGRLPSPSSLPWCRPRCSRLSRHSRHSLSWSSSSSSNSSPSWMISTSRRPTYSDTAQSHRRATALTAAPCSSSAGTDSSISLRRAKRLPTYVAPPNDTHTPPRMKKAEGEIYLRLHHGKMSFPYQSVRLVEVRERLLQRVIPADLPPRSLLPEPQPGRAVQPPPQRGRGGRAEQRHRPGEVPHGRRQLPPHEYTEERHRITS
ncbi:hypothetical protein EYF80_027081 [Liparis tanakae]|uniref:Uncharacterized protein n=1 Tax=Liparis tanakae TaxID=230148 RepID=A0A4Z2HAA3_9TELE|nr:hypothetical protein EYF80_027081 [Liparis tanakae]